MHINGHDFFNPYRGQRFDKPGFLPASQINPQVHAHANEDSHNDRGLETLSPGANQKILNQEILTALNKVLQADNATPIEQLNPDDFTPENVANRILNFVSLGLDNARNNGADEGALQKLYQQAQEGIERGFKEARQILDSLGVLQGKIAADIDQTYSLIHKGLARLADQLSATPATPVSIYTEQSTSVDIINSHSISLELETREGDKVTLTISDTQGAHSLKQSSSGGNASTESSAQLIYANSNIAYSVEGELNELELNDIRKLVSQIDQLSDKFFDGNFQGALARAMHLGNNTSELASFALNLEMSEVKQVTSTYQTISSFDGEDTPSTPAPLPTSASPTSDLMTAADFITDVKDAVSQPALAQQFKEPHKIFADLFEGAAKLHPKFAEQVPKIENQIEMSVKELIAQFLEAIQEQKEQPEPAEATEE